MTQDGEKRNASLSEREKVAIDRAATAENATGIKRSNDDRIVGGDVSQRIGSPTGDEPAVEVRKEESGSNSVSGSVGGLGATGLTGADRPGSGVTGEASTPGGMRQPSGDIREADIEATE